MNRGIERLAARVRRGRPTNEAETDHRARLLALCEGVQSATHAWSVFNDEPLCVNAAGLDYLWRALLVMASPTDGRDEAYMDRVIANLEATSPGGRNSALNGAAWTLGRWIAAGALEQHSAEDAMDANPEHIGLVADDGQRQCWATIRSGLSWMQTPSHTGKHNADGAASVLRVCHLG